MSVNEILGKVGAGYFTVGIVVLLSLIQISPLKLNPWDKLLGWVGKKVNGNAEKRMEKLEKQLREMWINNHRQSILTFARECRAEIAHSSDEWTNVLNVAEEYEKYVTENKVTNAFLQKIPFRGKLLKRLKEVANYEKVGTPFKKHGRWYIYKNNGLQNQSVLYTMDRLDGEQRVFLDPNTLSQDGTVALKGRV